MNYCFKLFTIVEVSNRPKEQKKSLNINIYVHLLGLLRTESFSRIPIHIFHLGRVAQLVKTLNNNRKFGDKNPTERLMGPSDPTSVPGSE